MLPETPNMEALLCLSGVRIHGAVHLDKATLALPSVIDPHAGLWRETCWRHKTAPAFVKVFTGHQTSLMSDN